MPIGGKYRLIDIPISNCLHADLKRIFVLTQFNSASLNRHIAQTYRLDMFSDGFVEVLAAEQTPDSSDWFQGTADAVRQAARHFGPVDADYYLILAGDHLYRMDFCELIDAHIEPRRHHHRGAAGHAVDATQMGIFRFDRPGRSPASRRSPNAARLAEIGEQRAARGDRRRAACRQAVRRLDGHLRVLARGAARDPRASPGIDFGKEIIPRRSATHRVHAYLFRGYWADVGTIEAFYDANIQLTRARRAVQLLPPALADLHAPAFPAGHACLRAAASTTSIVAEGCYLDQCEITRSVVGIRTHVKPGATITRSVLLGADFYEDEDARRTRPLGIGRDVVLDRVIVDKNAKMRRHVACRRGDRPRETARGVASATASSSCPRVPW